MSSRHSTNKSSYTNAHRRNAFEALTGETPPSVLRMPSTSSRSSRLSATPSGSYAGRIGSTYDDNIYPDDSASNIGVQRQRSSRSTHGPSRHGSHHNRAVDSYSRNRSQGPEDDYIPRPTPHNDSICGVHRPTLPGTSSRGYKQDLIDKHSRTRAHSYREADRQSVGRYREGDDEESEPETPRAHTRRPSILSRPLTASQYVEDAWSSYRAQAPRATAVRTNSRACPPSSFRHTTNFNPPPQEDYEPSRRSSVSRSGRSRSGSVSISQDPPRRSSHYDGDYDTVSSYTGNSRRSRRASESHYGPPSPPPSEYSGHGLAQSFARSMSISGSGAKTSRTRTVPVNDDGLNIRVRDDGKKEWDRKKTSTKKRGSKGPSKWLLWFAGGG